MKKEKHWRLACQYHVSWNATACSEELCGPNLAQQDSSGKRFVCPQWTRICYVTRARHSHLQCTV